MSFVSYNGLLYGISMEEESQGSCWLLVLPDEVLQLVLQCLGLRELLRCWATCWRLRALVEAPPPGVLHEAALRSARLPSAALRHTLFRRHALRLHLLDLSRLPALASATDLPPLRRMKALCTLNLTHSPVPFFFLRRICASLSSLRRLSFTFDPYSEWLKKKPCDMIMFDQDLDYLHIVYPQGTALINVGGFIPPLAVYVKNCKDLEITSMGHLFYKYFSKYTCPRIDYDCLLRFDDDFLHSKVSVFSFHCVYFDTGEILIDQCVPNNSWQYIIFNNYYKKPQVLLSSRLADLVDDNMYPDGIIMKCEGIISTIRILGLWSIYMWRNDIVTVNKDFYTLAIRELERTIPHFVCSEMYPDPKLFVRHSSNSYVISTCTWKACPVVECKDPKKRRLSKLCRLCLNIDEYVQADRELRITLRHSCNCANNRNELLDLDLHCAALKNITFLHIFNILALDKSFFKTLFEQCKKLTTLNVDVDKMAGHNLLLSSAVNSAFCLKNLRLHESDIHETKLYESLANCVALENLHVCDISKTRIQPLPSASLRLLLKNSVSLDTFVVHYASMSKSAKNKMLTFMKAAVPVGRKWLLHLAVDEYVNEAGYMENLIKDWHAEVFFEYNIFRSLRLDLKYPDD